MFDVFVCVEDFVDEVELFFYGFLWLDGCFGCVGVEEVLGVEVGKVLECVEEFVVVDGGVDEFEVVGDGGVVDYCVGDYFVWLFFGVCCGLWFLDGLVVIVVSVVVSECNLCW